MEKKLLIYNMPKDYRDIIQDLAQDHQATVYYAGEKDLGKNVAYLIDESQEEKIQDKEYKHVDINFLMIHGFGDEDLNKFLSDLKAKGLSLPNKCVSTQTNLAWFLYDLLVENEEESQLMPIIANLHRVYKVARSILDSEKDEDLSNHLDAIVEYFKEEELEREDLISFYNKAVRLVNPYLKD